MAVLRLIGFFLAILALLLIVAHFYQDERDKVPLDQRPAATILLKHKQTPPQYKYYHYTS